MTTWNRKKKKKNLKILFSRELNNKEKVNQNKEKNRRNK